MEDATLWPNFEGSDSTSGFPRTSPFLPLFEAETGAALGGISKLGALSFLASCLSLLILYRYSMSTLGLYLVFTVAVVHIYAITISKEGVFRSATIWLSGTSLVWGLWELHDWLLLHDRAPGWIPVRLLHNVMNLLSENVVFLSLGVWIIGVFWAIRLGGVKELHKACIPGRFFLASAAFVLGMWGVWAVLSTQNRVGDRLFQFAVVFILAAPLALLIALIRTNPFMREPFVGEQSDPTQGVSQEFRSLRLLFMFACILALYLIFLPSLAKFADYMLGRFLPTLLSSPRHAESELGWLSRLQDFNLTIAGLLAASALLSVASTSLSTTIRALPSMQPEWYRRSIVRLRSMMAESPSGKTDFLSQYAARIFGRLTQAAYLLYLFAAFTSSFLICCIKEVPNMLRESIWYLGRFARFVLVPFCSFTVLFLSGIAVMHHFREYLIETGEWSARSIWGQSITVIALTLLLCGLSFGFAPATAPNFLWEGGLNAAFSSLIVYFVISFTSPAVLFTWLAFSRSNVEFTVLKPGDLFQINLVVVSFVTALTVLPFWIFLRKAEQSSSRGPLLLLIAAPTFVLLGLWWGVRPIIEELHTVYEGSRQLL